MRFVWKLSAGGRRVDFQMATDSVVEAGFADTSIELPKQARDVKVLGDVSDKTEVVITFEDGSTARYRYQPNSVERWQPS